MKWLAFVLSSIQLLTVGDSLAAPPSSWKIELQNARLVPLSGNPTSTLPGRAPSPSVIQGAGPLVLAEFLLREDQYSLFESELFEAFEVNHTVKIKVDGDVSVLLGRTKQNMSSDGANGGTAELKVRLKKERSAHLVTLVDANGNVAEYSLVIDLQTNRTGEAAKTLRGVVFSQVSETLREPTGWKTDVDLKWSPRSSAAPLSRPYFWMKSSVTQGQVNSGTSTLGKVATTAGSAAWSLVTAQIETPLQLAVEPAVTKNQAGNFLAVIEVPPKSLLTDPYCDELGVKAEAGSTAAKWRWIAVSCVNTPGRWNLHLSVPTGWSVDQTQWNQAQTAVDLDASYKTFRVSFPSPGRPAYRDTPVGVVVFKTPEGLQVPIAIQLTAPKKLREAGMNKGPPAQRFYWSVGLGVTTLSYFENPLGISVSQVALTPKMNAGYRLVPGKLDLAANAFGYIWRISHSPAEVAGAYSWGANLRLGYTLPWHPGGINWSLSAGWYLWSFRADNSRYGLDLLIGPQWFFFTQKTFTERFSLYHYFKWAPIAEGLAFRWFNREFATGGGVQIPVPPFFARAWFATVDWAQMRFASTIRTNSLTLNTLTLGLQANF